MDGNFHATALRLKCENTVRISLVTGGQIIGQIQDVTSDSLQIEGERSTTGTFNIRLDKIVFIEEDWTL